MQKKNLLLAISIFLIFGNFCFAGDIQSILHQGSAVSLPADSVNHYIYFSGATLIEADSQILIPIENSTTSLRNFYIYAKNNNTTGNVEVAVRKNGVDTDIKFLIIPGQTGQAGWFSNTSTIVEFKKNDLFSIRTKNTGDKSIPIYHWVVEIFTQTTNGETTMIPEYIEQITSDSTTTSFYLDKTISFGDYIIITLLFLFLVFGIVKFCFDWFIPKKLDWKKH